MICRSRKKESWGKGQYTAVALFILILVIAQVESDKFRSVYDTPDMCKPGLFDCEDSNGCISASWVCDGEIDCSESKLDERQSCCSEGKQFECISDGLCVQLQYRCDSFADCADSSDEWNCTECQHMDLFHCQSDRCIDPVFICDQDNDCGDFSDETNCDQLHPNTYMCQNQLLTVGTEQLCNGVNDCGDMSDEIGCGPCEPFHFSCEDRRGCVLMFDLCDGQSQCYDGSDESWCHSECTRPHQFKCTNGNCVDRSQVCDHVNDCGDKSDEGVCSCESGSHFRCTSGTPTGHNNHHSNGSNIRCIPDEWVCDGVSDCKDSEDEREDMCEELQWAMTSLGAEQDADCDSEREFQCSDGECILSELVCDGIEHCFRGEDEVGCPASCPKGTYELCLMSDECISYDQFCDGNRDCGDNSDESFTNGYCFCSGILCDSTCVPIHKICDSNWDCKNGEDEIECTKCRTNLQSTNDLIDQTVFVISLIKTTYTQMDSFQIYFAALVDKWTAYFGTDDSSPFHMNVEEHDPNARELIKEAKDFLISIVSLRQPLRQFMAVMNELQLTDATLPNYAHSDTLSEGIPRMKRWIIERTINTEVYDDLIKRCEYLKQKSLDSIQTLSAITKMLHYDFSTCRDHKYFQYEKRNSKRSMREVFTALTLVQNDVPHADVNKFVNKLYNLDDQLQQLIVSVQKFDQIIASVAFLIDDAKEKLESMVKEADGQSRFITGKRDVLKRNIDNYKG